MGIKLKSSENRIVRKSVVFLSAAASLLVLWLYPTFQSRMKDNEERALEESREDSINSFIDVLCKGSSGLYWDYENRGKAEEISPSQLYISWKREGSGGKVQESHRETMEIASQDGEGQEETQWDAGEAAEAEETGEMEEAAESEGVAGTEEAVESEEMWETEYGRQENVYGDEAWPDSMSPEDLAAEFDRTFDEGYQNFLQEKVPSYSLEYAIYREQDKVLGNSVNDLSVFQDETAAEGLGELDKKYEFYVAVHFDEDGRISAWGFRGMDQPYISQLLSTLQDKSKVLSVSEVFSSDNVFYRDWLTFHAPSDVTIVFASARKLFYLTQAQEADIYSFPAWRFADAGLNTLVALLVLSMTAIGMMLPFAAERYDGTKRIYRVKLEWLLAAWVVLACVMELMEKMAYYTLNRELLSGIMLSSAGILRHWAEYGLNFGAWMLYFGFAYLCGQALHPLFRMGPVSYLKEQSYCGVMLLRGGKDTFRWFKKRKGGIRRFFGNVKEKVKSIGKVDLRNPIDRRLFILLVVNFIVVSGLCMLWFIGIFGMLFYTVVLFVLSREQYYRIQKNYMELLDGVHQMAEGNLEVDLKEDYGSFAAMKDELQEIQSGFKTAVEEETKSQRMRSELVTNVSHDLKTPLASIIMYINLLKEEEELEEMEDAQAGEGAEERERAGAAARRKKYIDTLDVKSQRLKRLIDDLFVISKASSNSIIFYPMVLDLVSLIKQVLFELDDRVTASQIEFRLHFNPDKLLVKLDCEKTYRIFENLVVNILKYGMPHSRAFITAEQTGEEIRVVLKNTSEAELTFRPDEITERFVRGDESRNTEGSGLGLAIAKSFTTLQGGSFEVQLDGDLFKVILGWKACKEDEDPGGGNN